jgi:hypothetical protein
MSTTRRSTSLRALAWIAAPLAAAAAAAGPAEAQRTAHHRAHEAAVPVASIRTLAVYRLSTTGENHLPAQLSLADSAGVVLASVSFDDGRAPVPMEVTLREADLVVRGDTPAGRLTLWLDGQNENSAPIARLTGRWRLGSEQGALLGRTAR